MPSTSRTVKPDLQDGFVTFLTCRDKTMFQGERVPAATQVSGADAKRPSTPTADAPGSGRDSEGGCAPRRDVRERIVEGLRVVLESNLDFAMALGHRAGER